MMYMARCFVSPAPLSRVILRSLTVVYDVYGACFVSPAPLSRVILRLLTVVYDVYGAVLCGLCSLIQHNINSGPGLSLQPILNIPTDAWNIFFEIVQEHV